MTHPDLVVAGRKISLRLGTLKEKLLFHMLITTLQNQFWKKLQTYSFIQKESTTQTPFFLADISRKNSMSKGHDLKTLQEVGRR